MDRIELHDIPPQILNSLIDFIYTGMKSNVYLKFKCNFEGQLLFDNNTIFMNEAQNEREILKYLLL